MVLELDSLKGKIYDVYEVAKLLGINADSVRLRIRKGDLPARKVPGDHAYCILGDDLAEYLMGTPHKPREPKKRAGRGITRGATKKPLKKALAMSGPESPAMFPEGAAGRDPATPPPSIDGAIPFRLPDAAKGRLKEWLRTTGKTLKALAVESGISESSLSYIIGEGKRATRALCRTNALKLRATYGDALLSYLTTGGPMPGGTPAIAAGETPDTLPPEAHDRLISWCEKHRVSIVELSSRTGISEMDISRILGGMERPSDSTFALMIEAFGSAWGAWVRTGNGPMPHGTAGC